MKKFDRDSWCVKCGAGKYQAGLVRITSTYEQGDDVVVRKCPVCGYRWEELPLDREDEG